MNAATTQVLDEMIHASMARRMLAEMTLIDDKTPLKLVLVYKVLGASKMIDEFEPQIAEQFADMGNLLRSNLALVGATVQKQEALVAAAHRAITVAFVGFVDKMSRGEPIDEEHARFQANRQKLEEAKTPADRMRAFADMLDGGKVPTKYTA